MGVKKKKRQYSLKFFFIKFILSLIIGAGVVLPYRWSWQHLQVIWDI